MVIPRWCPGSGSDKSLPSSRSAGPRQSSTGASCYAKSHLAALLRANGVATGFVYQRPDLDRAGAGVVAFKPTVQA